MEDLLSLAVAAHGGLARWKSFQMIEARMAASGVIFAAKQNPGLQDDVSYTVHTDEERVSIERFSAPDRRLPFTPDHLTLETASGAIVENAG
jgi:hypothetical protein